MPDFSEYRNKPFPLEILEDLQQQAERDTDQFGGFAGDLPADDPYQPYLFVQVIEQAPGTADYRVKEVVYDADAGFVFLDGGYESPEGVFNAREMADSVNVPADLEDGAIVQVWPSSHEVPGVGLGEGWIFDHVPAPDPGVSVRKNSTGAGWFRPRINLIEGSGVTLTVADDATDDEVDVTIASTAPTPVFSGGRVLVGVSQVVTVTPTALVLTTEDFDTGIHAGSDAFLTLGVGTWHYGISVEVTAPYHHSVAVRPYVAGSPVGPGVVAYHPPNDASTPFTSLHLGFSDLHRVNAGTVQLGFYISRSGVSPGFGGTNFAIAGGYAWAYKVG